MTPPTETALKPRQVIQNTAVLKALESEQKQTPVGVLAHLEEGAWKLYT